MCWLFKRRRAAKSTSTSTYNVIELEPLEEKAAGNAPNKVARPRAKSKQELQWMAAVGESEAQASEQLRYTKDQQGLELHVHKMFRRFDRECVAQLPYRT